MESTSTSNSFSGKVLVLKQKEFDTTLGSRLIEEEKAESTL
jgi:hypothetical protein